MINSVIKGIGINLPERLVTSQEAEKLANYEKFGLHYGLCKMLTGCETRHYVADGEYSSDLAYKAGKQALENAGIDPSEVDALLFCSVTHDFAEPATANVVADKLNVRNAFVFDIKNACNAFISGVDVADSFIKSGKAKTVLVVSGEAMSRWTKFDYDDKKEMMQRAPVTLSLGDGGGAFVLQAEESDTPNGILKTYFHTYSEKWKNNVVWGGGVMYPRDPEKMYIPGTTKEIIDMQVTAVSEAFPKIFGATGLTLDDVDCLVPSQVAKWVATNVIKEMHMNPEKVISVVEKYGNVGASNIPLATYEAVSTGKLKKGDTVLFYGGAVGISAGAILAKF